MEPSEKGTLVEMPSQARVNSTADEVRAERKAVLDEVTK
jgi:hypothetical protein